MKYVFCEKWCQEPISKQFIFHIFSIKLYDSNLPPSSNSIQKEHSLKNNKCVYTTKKSVKQENKQQSLRRGTYDTMNWKKKEFCLYRSPLGIMDEHVIPNVYATRLTSSLMIMMMMM